MKAVFYFSAIEIKDIAVRTIGQFFLLIVTKRSTWFVVNQKCSGLCVDQRVIPTSTQPTINARLDRCTAIGMRVFAICGGFTNDEAPYRGYPLGRWQPDVSRSLLQLIPVRSSDGSESSSGRLIQPRVQTGCTAEGMPGVERRPLRGMASRCLDTAD
jgi:hypothetical protein